MTSKNNLSLEIFDDKIYLGKQRVLFRECFPENNGTSVESMDHYLWKFHSFPSSPNSYEYIAKMDNDLIGYYAALPYEYIINGKSYIVGMVCDVMTGIKARGKGVFTKLGIYSTELMKIEGLAFTTGYPIRPEVIPGHIKAGWDIVFDLPLYISFLKVNGILKKKSVKCMSLFPNTLLYFLNKFVFHNPIKPPYKYKTFSSENIDGITELNDFLIKWMDGKPIVLNKTINFLKWRLSAPNKKYEIITLLENDILVGVAITASVIKEEIPSLAILDFMVLNNSKKYSKLLNSAIFNVAKKHEVEVILKMTSKFEAKQLAFGKSGYIKSPYKFTLIIKHLSDSINKDFLYNEENWHLSWIDSDDL
jgi:hypothetical protein